MQAFKMLKFHYYKSKIKEKKVEKKKTK
jgi:hypothetical protein